MKHINTYPIEYHGFKYSIIDGELHYLSNISDTFSFMPSKTDADIETLLYVLKNAEAQ